MTPASASRQWTRSADRPAGLSLIATLALVVVAGACGSEASPPAAGGGVTKAGLGQACGEAGCAAGLICVDGDWAPAPWCAKACDNPGDYCDQLEADSPAMAGSDPGAPLQGNSLCVALPGDFQGGTATFCAPICDNTDACRGLWTGWSKCAKPTWKNKVRYPALPTLVCQAPASQGQVVVDPVACDWEDKVTDPKFSNAKQVCKAYCSFLQICQLWDPKKEKLSCCQWRCFQDLTPGGTLDDAAEDLKKCYIKAFNSAQGTPKVCTLHREQCPAIGDPHAP